MGGIVAVQQGVKSTGPDDKIEAILSRVETLLREIHRNGNHGEISIRVTAGRIRITGGPEIEIK